MKINLNDGAMFVFLAFAIASCEIITDYSDSSTIKSCDNSCWPKQMIEMDLKNKICRCEGSILK